MGKLYRRDNRWGVDYRDHRGRRVRKVVAADKSVAQKVLGDALAAVEKLRAGVLTTDPRESERPLREHIWAYLSELNRRGRDGMYRYNIKRHLELAAAAQGWTCLRDITPRSIGEYLRDLADNGRTPKTVNQHRADLSAFLGYCVRHGALDCNAADRVSKSAVSGDRKRRALSVAECRALLAAAPPHRRVVYLTLLYTGLRRAEAAALRWGYVHLDVANPFIELPGSITKSGRPESVPLVPDVAAALREHRADAKDAAPVFDEIPTMPEFRDDLKAAGIEDEDERGRMVVLHSLRHSLATMLAGSNVPPAVAMKIMRHRDIRLTLMAYTDDSLLSAGAAMAGLPSMNGGAIDGAQNVPTSGLHGARRGTAASGA